MQFKVAVLIYKALHGSVPTCLNQLIRVADLPGGRSLRSEHTSRLQVSSVRLSTVGGPAFEVSGPTIWNDLPYNVTSALSLPTLRQRQKNFLFPVCLLDITPNKS